MCKPAIALVFFFQAEDGIRDRNVTGVQTCALPIYRVIPVIKQIRERSDIPISIDTRKGAVEIGRASCRERVYIGADQAPTNKNLQVHVRPAERRAAQAKHQPGSEEGEPTPRPDTLI